MFTNSDIANALVNRVGFRQTVDSAYPVLHSDLLQNEGLLVNSIAERWLRAEVLSDTLEHYEAMTFEDWDAAKNYVVGDFVKEGKQVYRALNDNNGSQPLSENWETALSYRLRQYRESAAKEVVKELIKARNYVTFTTGLKASNALFSARTKGANENKANLQRGVKISLKNEQGLKVRLSKIGLKLDTAQTVNFYLHHSDNLEPIVFPVEVTATEVNRFVWKNLTDEDGNSLEMKYWAQNNAGGEYYLTFFEEDIAGNYDVWDMSNYFYYNNFGKKISCNYFYVSPVEFTEEKQNKPNLPDVGEYLDNYTYDYEYPFNIRYEVLEDATEVILNNIERLDEVYQTKLAINLLTDMLYSPRVSNEGDDARGLLDNLLYGYKENNNLGLVGKYKKLLKSAIEDFSNLLSDKRGAVSHAI